MINETPFTQAKNEQEQSFDELMANLFVLVTHHSLTQCSQALPTIVAHLQQLCHHSEIEHYPNQFAVLIKMRKLWQTKLFESQTNAFQH